MMWWWQDASQSEGWPWWGMLMHGIWPIVFLGLAIAALVLFVRMVSGDRRSFPETDLPAARILEERYARGEIEREEYLQKRRDIGGRAEAA